MPGRPSLAISVGGVCKLRFWLFRPVVLKTHWRARGHTLGVCVCVWAALASVQRKVFRKCYGFGSSYHGTSGEVIKPVSSTLQ